MTESLTIALPFHRGGPYLKSAVESVLAQDSRDWQLLVCDDGPGNEDVPEWLDRLADPRIRYLRNDVQPEMAGNWNFALDRSDTELVTLLHADDLLEPGYVTLMRKLARAQPEAVAFCCEARIIGDRGEPRFSLADRIKAWFVPAGGDPLPLAGEAALAALLRGNFIMCPTLCYRRRVLGTRRFTTRWKQVLDLDLITNLLVEGETIFYARRTEYAYRRHAAAATALQSESRLRFREELTFYEETADRCEELGWTQAARVARSKSIVRLHLAYRALADVARLRPLGALELARAALTGRLGT